MDGKIAKSLIFGRSRGIDKVIFGCYNEVAPRKIGAYNWIKKDAEYKAIVTLTGKLKWATPPRPHSCERAIKRMCRTEITTSFGLRWLTIGMMILLHCSSYAYRDVDGQGWNWGPDCYIWFSFSRNQLIPRDRCYEKLCILRLTKQPQFSTDLINSTF